MNVRGEDIKVYEFARCKSNSTCACCAALLFALLLQSSALGTLSVVEALKVMSMESLVATKRKNDALMAGIADSKMCKFLSKDL